MLYVARKKQLKKFLTFLNIDSKDFELFDIALTHPSFNSEVNKNELPDYERLEFLGDSVLRLAASDYLYEKYKDFDEGKLTKIRSFLVSDAFLAKVALGYNINEYLNIGQHEAKDGGRKKESILACSMEAIFGALYISLGFEFAKNFIIEIYKTNDTDVNHLLYSYNSKELLQQYTQSINKDLPQYEIVSETGKDHAKTYEVSVKYNNEVLGTGLGKTKKEAEKTAAFNALKKLNLINVGCNE